MDQSKVLKDELQSIRASSHGYFEVVRSQWKRWVAEGDDLRGRYTHESKDFLDEHPTLAPALAELESSISVWAAKLAGAAKASALMSAADQNELRFNIRRMIAALNFREYQVFEAQLLHDQDTVYGVQPASQTERYVAIDSASRLFDTAAERLDYLLLFVHTDEYQNIASSQVALSVSGAQVPRRDTAFIMMWMSDELPDLDDVKAGIVEVFQEFNIKAVRADDIQHDDVITSRVLEEIASNEFLIADLTGARPNVYYEVGYAHALGKRVILFRKKDAELHFDLAGRNVPSYVNVKDLKNKLRVRLAAMLGVGA